MHAYPGHEQRRPQAGAAMGVHRLIAGGRRGNTPRRHVYRAATDFRRRVYCILGLPVDAVTVDQAVAAIEGSAKARQRCFLSTPNLNFLIGTLQDADFRESVIRSDLTIADGIPLVWIARAVGIPIRERVAGSSLFEELRQRCQHSLSVYFFGGKNGVAEGAGQKLNANTSRLACVGAQSPGFGSVEDMSRKDTIDHINASRPDFLVVALGAKKGHAWIDRNLAKIEAPVVSHLGAVVNFVAGTVSRAPVWIQRLGFEWIWRIKEEPELWRRYLSDGIAFMKLLFTRVIPCAIYVRLQGIDPAKLHAANLSVSRHGELCNIFLSGAWTEKNLDTLREAFESVTSTPCNVRLNFQDVEFIDSACVGLLVLLYGHQLKIGRGMTISRANPRIVRLIRLHCAEYLMHRFPNV